MINVALANKDQMDHLVIKVEMVTQEHQEMTVHLAVLVLMLKSEMNYCLYHLNVNVCLHPVLLDHPEVEEMMDHLETMAHLEAMDDLDLTDPLVLPDSPDNPDDLEIQDHPENLEPFDLAKPHHPVHLDNLDVPDNLDRPVDPVNLAKMVTTDHPANPDPLEMADHPDAMANLEALEIQDLLVPQEAATTAHQLVWLPDIKMQHPDIRTRHSRGHLFLSFLLYCLINFSRLEEMS